MDISPDQTIYFRELTAEWGFVKLNATIVWTWVTMAVVVLISWLITRRLSATPPRSRAQNLMETIVGAIRTQIAEISRDKPDRYLAFIGTLFVFIAASSVLGIVPGYRPPIGSLSTATALALCVFVAVPVFGIARRGPRAYLGSYLKPSPIMLPFNIIGELSRTLALAVRLFGNVMSGTLIVAILLGIVPLFFPILMQAFGLLIGMIQAYIFAVLAMVYIASATRAAPREPKAPSAPSTDSSDNTARSVT